MPNPIIDNFDLKANKFNFERDCFMKTVDMLTFPEAGVPDGFVAYCHELRKMFRVDKTAPSGAYGIWYEEPEGFNVLNINSEADLDTVPNGVYTYRMVVSVKPILKVESKYLYVFTNLQIRISKDGIQQRTKDTTWGEWVGIQGSGNNNVIEINNFPPGNLLEQYTEPGEYTVIVKNPEDGTAVMSFPLQVIKMYDEVVQFITMFLPAPWGKTTSQRVCKNGVWQTPDFVPTDYKEFSEIDEIKSPGVYRVSNGDMIVLMYVVTNGSIVVQQMYEGARMMVRSYGSNKVWTEWALYENIPYIIVPSIAASSFESYRNSAFSVYSFSTNGGAPRYSGMLYLFAEGNSGMETQMITYTENGVPVTKYRVYKNKAWQTPEFIDLPSSGGTGGGFVNSPTEPTDTSVIWYDSDETPTPISEIGDLRTLKTTSKDNLVNAINENVDNLDQLGRELRQKNNCIDDGISKIDATKAKSFMIVCKKKDGAFNNVDYSTIGIATDGFDMITLNAYGSADFAYTLTQGANYCIIFTLLDDGEYNVFINGVQIPKGNRYKAGKLSGDIAIFSHLKNNIALFNKGFIVYDIKTFDFQFSESDVMNWYNQGNIVDVYDYKGTGVISDYNCEGISTSSWIDSCSNVDILLEPNSAKRIKRFEKLSFGSGAPVSPPIAGFQQYIDYTNGKLYVCCGKPLGRVYNIADWRLQN